MLSGKVLSAGASHAQAIPEFFAHKTSKGWSPTYKQTEASNEKLSNAICIMRESGFSTPTISDTTIVSINCDMPIS